MKRSKEWVPTLHARLMVTSAASGQPSIDFEADNKLEAFQDIALQLGLSETDAALLLLDQIIGLIDLRLGAQAEMLLNGFMALLRDIKPRNGTESLLAVQMLAIHAAVMAEGRYCREAPSVEEHEIHTRTLGKLARTFAHQVEALTKLRHNRRSTITVKHVNVEKGGQAILGELKQKVGSNRNSKGQPHERVRVSKRKTMLS